MKKLLLQTLKNNWIIIAFVLSIFTVELTAVAVTSGAFFISSPWIIISIVLLISIILFFIRSQVGRLIVSVCVIAAIGTIDLVFIVIYEMTGQIFDFTMLQLRKDAMGIIESIPINTIYFFVVGLILSSLLVFGLRYARKMEALPKLRKVSISMPIALVLALTLNCVTVAVSIDERNFYNDLLYSEDNNTYNDLGIVGNMLSEFTRGVSKDPAEIENYKDLTNYIYNEDQIKLSSFRENYDKEYNVVTVLCETFEWMAIVEDLDVYPNGLNLYNEDGTKPSDSKTISQILFPNLYRFYDEAQVMTNFHSKEKTDMSENLSYLGAYPTNAITNYDFYENTLATAMPNMLRALDPDIQCLAFHNGTEDYYNRSKYSKATGFEDFISADDMLDMGMPDWMSKGERSLDADMIEICQDMMFPTDKRFFSYIITITQHGQYKYRDSLEERGYYDLLEKYGLKFEEASENIDELHNDFVTYVACALELDKAIGKIYEKLEERGLLEKTIITLFGDHNCYYSGISNYVKNIHDFEQAKEDGLNYLKLYNVPLMIRVPNMPHQVIDKFCSTADIVPTIYDLLGVNTFGNVFYGNSVYSKEESILYSRAYNFFSTGNVYYTSLNNIKFSYGNYDINSITERTKKLVKKIETTDLIFYNDYFKNKIYDVSIYNSDVEKNNCPTYSDLYNFRLKGIN